jgi:hypothetical protein
MSSYYTSIASHLPDACANGMASAVKHFDQTMTNGDKEAISSIKNVLRNAVRGSGRKILTASSDELSPADAAEWIRVVFSRFQVRIQPKYSFISLTTALRTRAVKAYRVSVTISTTPPWILSHPLKLGTPFW